LAKMSFLMSYFPGGTSVCFIYYNATIFTLDVPDLKSRKFEDRVFITSSVLEVTILIIILKNKGPSLSRS